MTTCSILELLDIDLKEQNKLQLSCIAGRSGLSNKITSSKISRPGLPLSGFFDSFAEQAVQVFGHGEQNYIDMLDSKKEYNTIQEIFSKNVPCCIFTYNYTPSDKIIDMAEKSNTPILQTTLQSSDFTRNLYQLLDEIFAPTKTIHGVLVEVYGIGVLITGDSGVGKSETALELIERGHRLISDDTVKIRNLGSTYLIGSGENPILAHHMEIRGIGIINLANIFGVGAIREKKQIQLMVHLEEWDSTKTYDRVGEDTLSETLLGIAVPKLVIPVKPGRNIPIIIETAARNERLKQLGYYSAKEFDQNVLKWFESEAARKMYYINEENI